VRAPCAPEVQDAWAPCAVHVRERCPVPSNCWLGYSWLRLVGLYVCRRVSTCVRLVMSHVMRHVTAYDAPAMRHTHTCHLSSVMRRQSEGASVVDLGMVSDDEASVDSMIDKALAQGARVLVTSGGVSMVRLFRLPA
jgi:hypothetical protein